MDDQDTELRNPFPSPPSHYSQYSSHNLNLLTLLHDRAQDPYNQDQHRILSDQPDVPDWPLVRLEKPRIDWILDEPDAYYDVFGDRWFVKEKIPSLAELGGHQLYPTDPGQDRRPALLAILRSILATYSALTSSLLLPPPPENVQPEWQRQVDWITVLSQNIMAAANDLRPVQARVNLELMMKRQLELRKEETRTLHAKCDALEAKLKDLRQSFQDMSAVKASAKTKSDDTLQADETPLNISQVDVLRWAEGC
ncbi:hypothetical protein APHAL10511_006068 [Amanita phalloides]|nr:hypothetical protein APHAL10511_006068 [Amanita phalloides]